MKYLLDTCLISELIKKKPNPGVVSWISGCDESSLYLSVITFGELRKGIAKLTDAVRKTELAEWLAGLEHRFDGRILPITLVTAMVWGKVQGELELRGTPMPSLDGLIACTALAHNLTVVTRNTTDMERSGVELVNPWV